MARIPEEQIERLKKEVDLAGLVRARGIDLKKHGAHDLIGLCPFHDDKDPSLVVSPKKNLWHCLGACQAGGSVIDWVMKSEGVSFRHAVELLRDGAITAQSQRKYTTTRRLDAPVVPDADDHELLRQVVDYYHRALKSNPEAMEYLRGRGLAHPELIDAFKLGLADRTLGLRLPAKQIKSGADIRARLQKLGIYRASGHEHFNGSIVFPIFDVQGQVLEMYGRKITKGLRKGTALHLYLPGPHRGVFNVRAFGATDEIILCESIIDALTFWCAGYRNVTASYGIEGFTDEMLAALKAHKIKRILIAYDRDTAGEKATEKLAQQLMEEGLGCYRIQFPKGMDANEYALQVTSAHQSLGLVIRKATWLGKGKAPRRNVQIPMSNDQTEAAKEKSDNAARQSIPPLAAEEAAKEETPSAPVEDPHIERQASPEPAAPGDVEAEVKTSEVTISQGDRTYRVRGLAKNMSYDQMKVNLLARRNVADPDSLGGGFHVDTFDLYAARPRATFIKLTGQELGVEENTIKKDLGQVLLKLEQLQDEQITAALAPKKKEITIDEADKNAALQLLKDPNLLDRILSDFAACGVVGEETNKLTGYLAGVSRKLDQPLAIIIQSSSAAGKSSLMEAILALMPPEEQVNYSAMTGQSLFYMGETNLKHKILAIAEEEGVEQASYALKLLQSEGQLTIASTGKNPDTGRMETQEYHVEGPVMIFLTTTAIDIDEELLNRCVVLTVDENRQQTRAIHDQQRKRQTLEGLLAAQDRQRILKLHRDAQRLLRPLLVANPYAEKLTFLDDKTRCRRDHMKYLTLIRAVALLHQYQRPVKTAEHNGVPVNYIEVTSHDISAAHRLADQVLGRSTDDLPPQTRKLLVLIVKMVQKKCKQLKIEQSDYRITRREVREYVGWSQTQLRIHLARLVDMEYVVTHRGGRGQTFVYELLHDGRGIEGQPTLSGLADASKLDSENSDYVEDPPRRDKNLAGQKAKLAGPKRGQNGVMAESKRAAKNGATRASANGKKRSSAKPR